MEEGGYGQRYSGAMARHSSSPPPFDPNAEFPGGVPHPPSDLAEKLFPRELTTELVARSEDGGAREVAQLLALAAGLTVLALGLPGERLWQGGAFVEALHDGSLGAAFYLPARISDALSTLLLRETSLYVLAALGWGLGFVGLARLQRRIGFEPGIALFAAGLAVAAPLGFGGGTYPLATIWGLAGTAWVMNAAFRWAREPRLPWIWPTALWLLACALSPECRWLGFLLAGSQRGARRLAFAGAALLLVGASFPLGDLVLPSLDNLLPRLAYPLLGCGILLETIPRMWRAQRPAEESPPPGWFLGLALVWIPAALTVPWMAGPSVSFLLVLGSVSCSDLLQSRSDAALARGTGLLLLLAQLVCCWMGTQVWFEQRDPLARWNRVAQQALEPTDLVLTREPGYRYLLARRYGLEVMDWESSLTAAEPLFARARAEGRRAIFAPGPKDQAPAAALLQPGVGFLGFDDVVMFGQVPATK